MPPIDPFFVESVEQSRVKAEIVAHYFKAWANVILPTTRSWGGTRVGYIDLFAGPGRYQDGTKSTPLLVLETAIADPKLSQTLVAMFNDSAEGHAAPLEAEIKALPGIDKLKHEPKVYTSEVGDAIVELFSKVTLIPSLVFIDPWGYKGLSVPLLRSVLKDWGCDCVFFFNYNRINMGLANAMVSEHMDAIFGAGRVAHLRDQVEGLSSALREKLILEALTAALKDLGGKFVLPFCFRNKHGRTTHYLISVTKHFKGYEIMRAIMARHSTRVVDNVPSLEHSLKELNELSPELPLEHPIDDLKAHLLKAYSGRTLSVRQIFEADSIGKRYLLENYKEVLRSLELDGRIRANPPADLRPKRKGQVTIADKTQIMFP